MTKEELIALARAEAPKHGLDPALVCAVCEQESTWDPFAIRYEPGFYATYVAPHFPEQATESICRAISFGLMQLMGQCARELGFRPSLGSLMDPATNLKFGCAHLANKLAHAGGDVAKGLLAWNGGGDKAYPAEVLARIASYPASEAPQAV